MYLALPVSYLLVLVLAMPAAGFLVRTYIVFHDCAHGSYFSSRRANAWVGSVLGLVVLTPFARWRHEHAVHHATSGDLDRRGVGDIPMLTRRRVPRRARGVVASGTALFRNPFVMFVLGSDLLDVRAATLAPAAGLARGSVAASGHQPGARRRGRGAVLAGSAGRRVLLVEMPLVVLAGAVGIWLFYVQHQFEGTYWSRTPEWSFSDAALHGSSYLALPRCCSSSPATSGSTTSTTSTRGSPTTTCNGRTTRQAVFRVGSHAVAP